MSFILADNSTAPFVSGGKPECKIACDHIQFRDDGTCYCPGPPYNEEFTQGSSSGFITSGNYSDSVSTGGEVVSFESQSSEKNQSVSSATNQSNITGNLNNITSLSLNNLPEECNGCLLNESCYPINNVKDNKYCSVNKEWNVQRNDNEFCENNFECQSNLCVNKACINQGFLQKIIDWFTKLFA